jgi:Zn-dependent metalloprotease
MHRQPCRCWIVPPNLLRRLAAEADAEDDRRRLQSTYVQTLAMRTQREASRQAAQFLRGAVGGTVAPLFIDQPHLTLVRVFDCQHRASLPGEPVLSSQTGDPAYKIVFDTTTQLVEFYRSLFGRESVDGQGLDLVSSVHYRTNFANAFWDGQQMVYGDGDGRIFDPLYRAPDVIAHELTHGVTQYESGLRYDGEPGALNESLSDVFGAVFNQWVHKFPASEAKGWLIGADIIAAQSRATYACLRDMLEPGAAHCLSPQPDSYDKFDPTADVHDNSGIPNRAFALFARAVGGNGWDRAIQVWYRAATGGRTGSNATFVQFARATLTEATAAGLEAPLRAAWQTVRVPLDPVAA